MNFDLSLSFNSIGKIGASRSSGMVGVCVCVCFTYSRQRAVFFIKSNPCRRSTGTEKVDVPFSTYHQPKYSTTLPKNFPYLYELTESRPLCCSLRELEKEEAGQYMLKKLKGTVTRYSKSGLSVFLAVGLQVVLSTPTFSYYGSLQRWRTWYLRKGSVEGQKLHRGERLDKKMMIHDLVAFLLLQDSPPTKNIIIIIHLGPNKTFCSPRATFPGIPKPQTF